MKEKGLFIPVKDVMEFGRPISGASWQEVKSRFTKEEQLCAVTERTRDGNRIAELIRTEDAFREVSISAALYAISNKLAAQARIQ